MANCGCYCNCFCFDQGSGTDPGALTTSQAAPSQGNAAPASNSSLAGLIDSLSRVGIVIASAVTDRPVVQTKNGVQTLGSKPLVTGQVTANMVVVVAGVGLVAVALIFALRGGK